MSAAGNHHYIPQFHLRRWEGDDAKISQWSRVKHTERLSKRRISVAATAYVPGLYSLEYVNPTAVQALETEVLGQIETKAAKVLGKLIATGPGPLSIDDRYWWTRYLQASLLRVPHVVQKMRTEGRRMAREHLSGDDEEFRAVKGSAPENTLLEWTEKHATQAIANAGLRVLVRMLMNERVIDRIIHFGWVVRDVSKSSRPLLIGDYPFERIGDLYKPRCLISIPLTPRHVFFGTDAPEVIERIENMNDRKIVNASNVSAVSTAKRFVYGEAEESFIDRYLPA